MTEKETDAANVTLDLLAIQSNALEAIRDYNRYLRNAENAGLPEVAYLVHLLMEEVGHPGNLGGHETWEDAGSWRHSGSTRMSCANAR